MLNKGLILVFAVMLSSYSLRAQSSGKVEVSKDTLITILQNFRAENEINPTSASSVSLGTKPVDKSTGTRVKRRGFRVQIYSGASRNEAYATQSRFKSQNANMDTYVNYHEPNYRVKVGNFTSREEANTYMRSLRGQYTGVFVIQEDIWIWE